jgi:putative NADH-flavin reductase
MTTLALFGATGRTGARVLDLCRARGDRVRALARDPGKLPRHADLEAFAGDARDAAAVERTLAGADAVIVCLGMQDITVPATDFSDAVRTIVRAMQARGPRRILAIASAGALPDARGGLRNQYDLPAWLANVAAEHTRNYETLRDCGLDWTLMCPVDLVDDVPAGHARRAFEDLPAGGSRTGYADLAQALVDLVADRASFGHRVGIVSPG